ncbi:hemicentin-1-like isoform X2 [Hydractinia symbiolongicarpus]|nr:hemicentin-1-like isoform X2 [Hydractinia symbiolongicarpus]
MLTCVATDTSNVQIKWFRNGVEINQNVMVLFTVHEISDTLLGYYVSSLQINYATNVTNGTYSCRAQGIKRTEQFFTEVEVYYAAQIVGYTSYVVVGNEMAVLQCSARGNPLPTFTWFKGSSRISFISVKYTRNDTSYSDVTQSILVIRNPTDHDLTTYTCKAQNTIAENIPITVEKSITVYRTSLPHFQHNLVDGPFRVKTTLTLNVSVTSSPNSTFVWYRNSIIISQPVTKTTRQFTTSNLTSQTNIIQLNTSGFYFVEACNIGGCVRSKTVKVEIEGHVSMKNYSFLQPVQNLTEGQSHTHECIATGYPEPIIIYWYLTVRSIRSQQQAGWTSFRSGQNFISRLDYSFIDKDDGGVLECVATNGVLRASVSTTIAVKYKPKLSATPALVKYVALDSNESLSCVAYGKEPPTIKWSKKTNYATLNYTNVHIDNRTGQVISILRLQQASFNDAGTYICNASNSAGSNYFTTRLEIHYPVKIYQYPPAILQASENDINYNISCYASGSPEPRILWLKNGVAVSFTELYRIRNVAINSSAVLSTLELKVVNKIDHANWSCQASNVLVGNQSTFDIATTFLNVAYVPDFNSTQKLRTVAEGSDVSLPCQVISYPASNISWIGPVDFTIDPRFLLDDLKLVEVQSSYVVVERTLNIHNVSRMDAGYYNCSAINSEERKVYRQIELVVHYPVEIYQRPPEVSRVSEFDAGYNMMCDASGLPLPTISWLKNGVMFLSSNYSIRNITLNSSAVSSILTIKNVQQSDHGNWTCRAHNSLVGGQSRSDSATTLLKVTHDPAFILYPPEKYVEIEGSNVSLICRVRSYPASNISWDGPVNFAINERFVLGDQKAVEIESSHVILERMLKIQNVSRMDAGYYNCSAVNTVSETLQKPTYLNVQFPVKIYQRPPNVSKVEESVISYNLSCYAEGWPRPTISWFKGDVNVVPTHRVHLKEMNFIAISVLEIINVNQSHYGNWSCLGRNVLNQSQETMDRATTLLRVLYNPIFLSPPTEKQRTVIEGSDVSLVCQVRSYPASNVSWNLLDNFQSDSRFVFEDQNVVLKSNDAFVEKTLKIQNISRRDAGLYRCSASNSGDRIFLRETRLVVQYASSITTNLNGGMHRIMEGSRLELHFGITSVPPSNFTWTMDGVVLVKQTGQEGTSFQTSVFNRTIFRNQSAQYRASACNFLGCINSRITNVIVEFPPTHQIQQASIAVEQNKKVNFTCRVSSEPVSSILWLYKGSELAVDRDNVNVINSENVSKYFTTATSVISIRDVRKDTHSGVYTCKATNKVDVVNHTIELIVVLNPPELLTKLNLQYNVNTNSTLSLSCVARSNELPHIVWYKDNVQIRNDSNNALLRHVSGKETINVTLLIQPVKDNSTGVYRCEATNVAGSAKNVTQVTVYYPPRIDKNRSNILRTIEFTTDYTNLSCSATSYPNPTFVWFKDGVQLAQNSPGYVITNTILYSRITIRNVGRRDFGKWKCMAENRLVGNLLRTDAFTITLLVSYSPGFAPSYPKQLYLAAEGNNVSLICRVNSYPPPSYVRWTTPVNVTIDNQRVFVQDDIRHADNKTLGTVLVITNVSRTDSGFYTCESSNSQGTKNISRELEVQYLPIPEDLRDQVVFVSGNAVLKCTVIGEPLPNITWWFNGKQVLSDVTHKLISHVINDGMIQVTSVLNIFNVKKEQDEGVYTCRATNDIDTGEKNVTLTVQVIPDGFKPAPEKKFNGLFEYYGLALKIQGINFSISDITTQRDFMKDEFNRSLVLALTSIFNDIVNNSVVAVTIQKPFINKQVNFTITLRLTVTESTKQLTKSFQESLMKNDGQLFQNGSSFCASVKPDTITVLDYNECDFASNCSKNAYCLNLNESSTYACKCKAGYTGNGFVCVVKTDKENIFIITLATIIAFGIIVVIALLYLARRKLKKETEKFKSNVQKQMTETNGYKNGRMSDPKVWMNNLPQDTQKIKFKNKRKK